MDPLSAVGLAGNIVQFVQFSCSLVSKTSEIYQSTSGELKHNVELDLIAKNIWNHCNRIEKGASGFNDDSTLRKLASSCKLIAVELTCAIAEIQRRSGQSSGRWQSFRQALKSIMKSDDIKRLYDRLQTLSSQMNTHSLTLLRTEQSEMKKMLQSLLDNRGSRDVPSIAQQNYLREYPSITKGLSGLVCDPARIDDAGEYDRETENLLATLLEQIKLDAAFVDTITKEQRVLQSLEFDGMNNREEQICEAHFETFDWMLHPELRSNDSNIGASFVRWLRVSNDIYWVAGKPGSGKSTLMKYLFNQPKTKENLEVWAGNEALVMARYYFWHRGSTLQRSQKGLLQSLLYTIIEASPGLAEKICPKRMTSPELSWSHKELLGVFDALQHTRLSNMKFCFFIDGLDEYSGDHFELVEFLQKLSASTRFKLCLSSRPWNCFEDSFGTCVDLRLYLQELTRPDMEKYVQDKLARAKEQSISTDESADFQALIHEVVEKSQGVFLWVALVVRSLREGLVNGDTISLLTKRVRAFPADLEPFFETLISSVDHTYQSIMAKSFLVALETITLPLATHAFLEEDWDYPIRLQCHILRDEEIVQVEKRMRRRINGRYKGLLECYQYNLGHGNIVVEFLHRTVRDFLQTAHMQRMLLSYLEADFDASLQLCRIRLAQLKTMSPSRSAYTIFDQILYFSQQYQRHTGKCDYEMLESLRTTIQDRRDIPVNTDAYYLGLLARKGLISYVKKHLMQRPEWLPGRRAASPILILLKREFHDTESWFHNGMLVEDLEDESEIISLVQAFLEAGADPCNTCSGISPWQFLASYLTKDPRERPSILRNTLLPLLEECIEHGATLSDLLAGQSDNVWLVEFIHQIVRCRHRIPEALIFVEKLFKSGCRPSERFSKSPDESFWSMVLAGIEEATSTNKRIIGAVDVVELCLRYGADSSDPRLLGLIHGESLGQIERSRLSIIIQESDSCTRGGKKRKHRRKKPNHQNEKTRSGNLAE